MSATAGCVTEEELLEELGTVIEEDRDRAAEICEILFGDPTIADTNWLCRTACTIRRVCIRNPAQNHEGRPAVLGPLDPLLPSVIVPTGPARRFPA